MERDRKQDQKVQREYTARGAAPACKCNCNNRSSSNHSNALAVLGMRKPVVEETNAGALKLQEPVVEVTCSSLLST